jgi:hypothetical protein
MPTHIARGSPPRAGPDCAVTLRTRAQQISFFKGKIVATESLDLDRFVGAHATSQDFFLSVHQPPPPPPPSRCSPHSIIISCDPPADASAGSSGCSHIVPGYIDWQINGCYGIDFSADDSGASLTHGVAAAAKLLPRHGVTAFCPTVVTSPPDVYSRCLPHFSPSCGGGAAGSHVLGLHLEGPVLSPSKAGAHRLQLLRVPAAASRCLPPRPPPPHTHTHNF